MINAGLDTVAALDLSALEPQDLLQLAALLIAGTLAVFGVTCEKPVRPRRSDRKQRVIVLQR